MLIRGRVPVAVLHFVLGAVVLVAASLLLQSTLGEEELFVVGSGLGIVGAALMILESYVMLKWGRGEDQYVNDS